jgi:hypothetical protein
MREGKYAFVDYMCGSQGSSFQVSVRKRQLHPTKGWRDQADHTKYFDSLYEALKYAHNIGWRGE